MIPRGLNDSEYKARWNAIFQPEGAPPTRDSNAGSTHAGGRGGGQPMPPPAWQGQQGTGQLNPAAPPHDPQGQQGLFLAPVPPEGGATTPPAVPAPQAPAQQLGGAQIAVQPPGGQGGAGAGLPQPPVGIGTNENPPQDYSGVLSALEHLAPITTDADTARSLRWQREVDGDATKLASWKIEAKAVPVLQFFAYMQPGEAFMVVGHTMSTIYSTTMDVATYHGKVVLFMGDWTGTRKCVPVILPPFLALAWKKCLVVDDKTRLGKW